MGAAVTIAELHKILGEHINSGHGKANIDIFEMRTSSTMPVVGVELMAEDDCAIIVDMADS